MNRRQRTKRPVDELPLGPSEIHAAVTRGVRDAARYDDDLEDFIQGAWVALLENLPRLKGLAPESVPGYIRRIARNATVDALRRDGAKKRGGDATTLPAREEFLSSRIASPEKTAIDRQELRQTLRRAEGRGRLTPMILRLLFVRGLSPEHAAQKLGIQTGTIYSTLYRARARLRQPA